MELSNSGNIAADFPALSVHEIEINPCSVLENFRLRWEKLSSPSLIHFSASASSCGGFCSAASGRTQLIESRTAVTERTERFSIIAPPRQLCLYRPGSSNSPPI